MAAGEKNHEAMMKHATKVPNDTVFFMDNGALVLDLRNARSDRQFLSSLIPAHKMGWPPLQAAYQWKIVSRSTKVRSQT